MPWARCFCPFRALKPPAMVLLPKNQAINNMEILIGLFIIAIGAFCQSSCYVPINKIKDWSWESYWVVQGVFAWLILPFFGAMLAVPSGHSFFELLDGNGFNVAMTMLFGGNQPCPGCHQGKTQ